MELEDWVVGRIAMQEQSRTGLEGGEVGGVGVKEDY